MNFFKDEPWSYTYCGDDEGYYLDVLCGSSGLYTITFKLNEEETEEARVNAFFIPYLVQDVRNYPEKYSPRQSKEVEQKVRLAQKAYQMKTSNKESL